MLDDRAAVAQAQQGGPEAFAPLVRQYQEAAFRAAYLIVRDEAEAQDVAQEAFVRAYRSLDRFDTTRPFRPWLLRIVTNLAINSRRSAGRRAVMSERYRQDTTLHGQERSPEAAALLAEESRLVWAAVGDLKAQEQMVLYLRYFLGNSEEETAMAIGRPVGTVKSRMHRALRHLRDVIEERYPELTPTARAGETVRREA